MDNVILPVTLMKMERNKKFHLELIVPNSWKIYSSLLMRSSEIYLLRKENNVYPSYRMIDTAPVENERYVPYFYYSQFDGLYGSGVKEVKL